MAPGGREKASRGYGSEAGIGKRGIRRERIVGKGGGEMLRHLKGAGN